MAKGKRTDGNGGVYSRKLADGQTVYYYSYTGQKPDGTPVRVLKRTNEFGERFTDRKAAEQALRDELVAKDKGRVVQPSRQKLGEFLLKTWLPARKGLADSSRRLYTDRLTKHVLPQRINGRVLGEVEMGKVTSDDMRKLFAKLEADGMSPGTLAAVKAPLNAAFNWAVAEGYRRSGNPVTRVELPDAAQTLDEDESESRKVWELTEAEEFLTWADTNDPDRAPMWRVAFATGLRRGELLGLRWEDVDGGMLNVRRQLRPGVQGHGELAVLKSSAKTGKRSRRVAIRNDDEPLFDAESVLRSWKKHQGAIDLGLVQPNAYVFGDADGNHVKWPNQLSAQWDSAVRRYREFKGHSAPIEITLHGTRHSHLTWLLNAGVAVKIVAERAGNTPKVTLASYSWVLEKEQEDQFARAGRNARDRSVRSA